MAPRHAAADDMAVFARMTRKVGPHGRARCTSVAFLAALVASGSLAPGAPAQVSAAARGEGWLNRSTVAVAVAVGDTPSYTSGIVVDARRGLVLTAAHTLWGARSIKLGTDVGVLHGRLVARAPCDDLALIEAQPRMPGLSALPIVDAQPAGVLTVVGRRWDPSLPEGPQALLSIPTSTIGPSGRAQLHPLLPSLEAVPLDGSVVSSSNGGPVLDARGRLVGMAVANSASQGLVVPGRVIRTRLSELRPGESTVYVGWRERYRCAPRLNAFAAAAFPGFKPADARLNPEVAPTRLPGIEEPAG